MLKNNLNKCTKISHALAGGCPTGWKEKGGKCYWVSLDEAKYTDAVAACVKLGSHLIGLPNKETIQHLRGSFLKG